LVINKKELNGILSINPYLMVVKQEIKTFGQNKTSWKFSPPQKIGDFRRTDQSLKRH
jgi:hypothetical protein